MLYSPYKAIFGNKYELGTVDPNYPRLLRGSASEWTGCSHLHAKRIALSPRAHTREP